jgi:hypothetical protein
MSALSAVALKKYPVCPENALSMGIFSVRAAPVKYQYAITHPLETQYHCRRYHGARRQVFIG